MSIVAPSPLRKILAPVVIVIPRFFSLPQHTMGYDLSLFVLMELILDFLARVGRVKMPIDSSRTNATKPTRAER